MKRGNFQVFVKAKEYIDDWQGSHENTNQESLRVIFQLTNYM